MQQWLERQQAKWVSNRGYRRKYWRFIEHFYEKPSRRTGLLLVVRTHQQKSNSSSLFRPTTRLWPMPKASSENKPRKSTEKIFGPLNIGYDTVTNKSSCYKCRVSKRSSLLLKPLLRDRRYSWGQRFSFKEDAIIHVERAAPPWHFLLSVWRIALVGTWELPLGQWDRSVCFCREIHSHFLLSIRRITHFKKDSAAARNQTFPHHEESFHSGVSTTSSYPQKVLSRLKPANIFRYERWQALQGFLSTHELCENICDTRSWSWHWHQVFPIRSWKNASTTGSQQAAREIIPSLLGCHEGGSKGEQGTKVKSFL